ncbi:MAG: HlyD family type I secretion periplasmic adaptor subunit [Dongiaceae bacterium]
MKPLRDMLNEFLRIHRDEVEFMPEAAAASERGAKLFYHLLLIFIGIFFVIFILWAGFAQVDEVARGAGKVIPTSRIQVIQNLEGGIVEDIKVREGDIVEKGQVLLQIRNSMAQADFSAGRVKYMGILAAMTRLAAEANGKDRIEFPPEVVKEVPEAARIEEANFYSRRNELLSQVSVFESQMAQRQQEVAELSGRAENIERSLNLAREEKKILEPLVQQGVSSKIELLRVERQVADLQSQMENVRMSIPRARSAIEEARRRIQERKATFSSQASAELAQRRAEIATLTQTMTASQDRVARTEVTSPLRGTVQALKINTIGGVIKPGEEIVQIVPIEDVLLVEARVRPADIAFIREGQKAIVKITAYDYSIYGGLNANVANVSADSITDDKGESYFKVLLKTSGNTLDKQDKPLQITPGMTASVDIITGRKTVLDYLLKPILKAQENALRER